MAKQSQNEPDRLTQVQQSDLAESRVNEEFVDWLKKWGNGILLVILLVALAGVGWSWLQRQAAAERDTAWANLQGAQLPASLEEVAKESTGVDSVSTLALLGAADQYLTSVQNGTRFDREATDEDYQLDAETRKLYLERANTLYAEAITSVGNTYETTFAKKLLVISALFGQAAIAESEGNIEASKQALAQVVAIANPQYPQLAEQATARTESLAALSTPITLPTQADLPEPPAPVELPDPTELLRPNEATSTETSSAPEGGDASSLILEGANPSAAPVAPKPAPPSATKPVPPADPKPAPPADPKPTPPADPAPAPQGSGSDGG